MCVCVISVTWNNVSRTNRFNRVKQRHIIKLSVVCSSRYMTLRVYFDYTFPKLFYMPRNAWSANFRFRIVLCIFTFKMRWKLCPYSIAVVFIQMSLLFLHSKIWCAISFVRSINVNSDTCCQAVCLLVLAKATTLVISQTNYKRNEHKKCEENTKLKMNKREKKKKTNSTK